MRFRLSFFGKNTAGVSSGHGAVGAGLCTRFSGKRIFCFQALLTGLYLVGKRVATGDLEALVEYRRSMKSQNTDGNPFSHL